MPLGIFGGKKEPRKDPRDPDRERSAEEEALAEKAAAEAARRAEERRGQVSDVSDLLNDILGPAPEEPPPASAGPNIDMILEAEPEAEAPEPLPLQEDLPEPIPTPLPFSVEPEPVMATAAAGGVPESSGPAAAVLEEIYAVGRSSEDALLHFEPAETAGNFDETMTGLALGRRYTPELAFEPEEAAQEPPASTPVSEDRAPQKTVVMHAAAGDEPESEPSREYSLDDLPAAPEATRAEFEDEAAADAGDLLEDEQLADSSILKSAPVAERPSRPARPPSEPPPEPTDDDEGLDQALAAAEAAGAGLGLGQMEEDEEEGEPPAPLLQESVPPGDVEPEPEPEPAREPASEPVPETVAPPEPEAAPAPVPEKQYSLDDLPEATPPSQAIEPSDEREAPDDRMGEQSLPDLSVAGAAAPSAGEPHPGSLTGLERMVDGSMEPSTAQHPAAGGQESAAPPPGAEEVVGAQRAADLDADQLAAVERFIESQVEDEVRPEVPEEAPAEPKVGLLLGALQSLAGRLGAVVGKVQEALDRKLLPYSLDSKRVLGIAGVLVLVVVSALSWRIWVQPWLRGPG